MTSLPLSDQHTKRQSEHISNISGNTYILKYLHSYILTYILVLTYILTYIFIYLHTYLYTYIPTYILTYILIFYKLTWRKEYKRFPVVKDLLKELDLLLTFSELHRP